MAKQTPEQLGLRASVEAKDGVLTIRQGDALPLREPIQVNLEGNIDAPKRYNDVRKNLIECTTTYVAVNRRSGTIRLRVDESNPYGACITGVLKVNPDLKEWEINGEETFTMQELFSHLRTRRRFFAEDTQYARLIDKLAEYKAKSTITIEAKNDRKGNVTDLKQKQSEINLDTNFTLFLPLFEGTPAKTFRVEIFLEVTDGGAEFWFESEELLSLTEQVRDQVFDEQVEALKKYVIIEQ